MSVDEMDAFRFDTVDSTNDQAKRLIVDGTITRSAYIVAREQTAGRGTHDRQWVSPKDAGIYLSVVFMADERVLPVTSDYTVLVGHACVDVLRRETGVDVRLQPINDLYVGSKKLGGILTEALFTQDKISALIVGVGINLRRMNRSLPAGSSPAVSMEELLVSEAFVQLDIDAMAQALVEGVCRSIVSLDRYDPEVQRMRPARCLKTKVAKGASGTPFSQEFLRSFPAERS